MDEAYKAFINTIAHIYAKGILEMLVELGILAKEHREEYLQRVDDFFVKKPQISIPQDQSNGKYAATHKS